MVNQCLEIPHAGTCSEGTLRLHARIFCKFNSLDWVVSNLPSIVQMKSFIATRVIPIFVNLRYFCKLLERIQKIRYTNTFDPNFKIYFYDPYIGIIRKTFIMALNPFCNETFQINPN